MALILIDLLIKQSFLLISLLGIELDVETLKMYRIDSPGLCISQYKDIEMHINNYVRKCALVPSVE